MNYSGRCIVKCSTDKESKGMFQPAELSLPPVTCQPGTINSPGWPEPSFPPALCTQRSCSCTLGLCWESSQESDKFATSPRARGWMSPAAPPQNSPEWLRRGRCGKHFVHLLHWKKWPKSAGKAACSCFSSAGGFVRVCWTIWIQLAGNFRLSAVQGESGTWGDRYF